MDWTFTYVDNLVIDWPLIRNSRKIDRWAFEKFQLDGWEQRAERAIECAYLHSLELCALCTNSWAINRLLYRNYSVIDPDLPQRWVVWCGVVCGV